MNHEDVLLIVRTIKHATMVLAVMQTLLTVFLLVFLLTLLKLKDD